MEGVAQAQDEAVTVGRVREALGKGFGDVQLDLGQGRGRSQEVERVSPDYPWRRLTQKTLGLTAVATWGEDCRKGLGFVSDPESSWW